MSLESNPPPASSTIVSRVIVGGFWSLAGVGGQAVVQLTTLMVLARQLSPADFGLAGAAVIFVLLSRMFSELGIAPALVQRENIEQAHIKTATAIALMLSIAAASLMIMQAHAIADFFEMPLLEQMLPFYAIIFLVRGLSVVSEALLQREMDFRLLAGIDLVSFVLGYAGVGIGMALSGMGVWSLVGAHVGQAAFRSVGLLWVRPINALPILNLKVAGQLMRFGFGYTLGNIAAFFAGQGDGVIVAKMLGADALGIYGRAYQLIVMPANLLGKAIEQVLFPAISKIQSDSVRLARNYRRGLTLLALISIPATAILISLAPEIVALLLGRGWGDVVLPFQIMAVGLALRMSYKLSETLAKAAGVVYNRAARQAVHAILVVSLAFVAYPWGHAGVAVAVQVAVAVNFLLMTSLGRAITGLTRWQISQALLPGIAMGFLFFVLAQLLVWQLRGMDAPALVVVFGIILGSGVVFLLAIRVLNKKFLGSDGYWILENLCAVLPHRLGIWIRKWVLHPTQRRAANGI